MPIIEVHPVVRSLDALPYELTLIGSRALGLHRPESDHDFLLVKPEYKGFGDDPSVAATLVAIGFRATKDGGHYGLDRSADVYTWTDATTTKRPSVDVIAVSPDEAKRRLAFFTALRAAGVEKAGEFHRAMKSEKAWPTLWATLRALI